MYRQFSVSLFFLVTFIVSANEPISANLPLDNGHESVSRPSCAAWCWLTNTPDGGTSGKGGRWIQGPFVADGNSRAEAFNKIISSCAQSKTYYGYEYYRLYSTRYITKDHARRANIFDDCIG